MLIYHCDSCKEVWDYNDGGKLGVVDHTVLCGKCENLHSPTEESQEKEEKQAENSSATE